MTNQKNLFKNISLFLCLVPMLLLSLFCLVPSKQDYNVSAFGDLVITNYNFVGSNIIMPISLQNMSSDSLDRQTFANIVLSFGLVDGIYTASAYGVTHLANMSSVYTFGGSLNNVSNAEDIVVRTNFLNVYFDAAPSFGYKIIVFHSGQLTSDIIKVRYSHYQNTSTSIFKPANFYNTITYYDVNGEYIEFQFPLFSNGQTLASNYLFEERIYYFTSSFDDNTYYQYGYDDGYNSGVADGNNLGYENGYNTGYDVGYGSGYNEGIVSSQDYSFLALIGAVIDAPVSAFTGLLNFNLLGFNMLAFVTSLITLSAILLIVKLLVGGK